MPNDIHAQRRQKLAALRAVGDAYPNDFRRSHTAGQLAAAHGDKDRDTLEAEKNTAAVAGRLMLHRRMGKAAFFTLQDSSARLQVYAGKKTMGESAFAAADSLDMGDIIGCEGELFKTNSGELTLRAATMRLLVKSLHPPPEKYHGLTDVNSRYRRRYLSLNANPGERDVFLKRAKIVRFLRDFLHARDYHEMETPILQPIPGGAAARPFVTHCHALSSDFYLRIAQELYIKRLLVGGFDRVFEMNRNFRNEGVSPRHNPEFTMLEFNAAYQNGEDFMALTETLLNELAVHVCGGEEIEYQGNTISFKRPFARVSPIEAILRECPDYDKQQLHQREFLLGRLAEGEHEGKKVEEAAALTIGELQLLLFEKTAEHRLIQPTFLVDYPAAASPLARRSMADPEMAERFELFVAGFELVNGFSELNDPDAQAEIFRQQSDKKDAGDAEAMHYDADYIHALECGLPPNAGGGIGIERLVMLLTNQSSIRDVILFPQLRRQDTPD